MRKLAHNIKLSVFVREDEEDSAPVEEALISLVPFEDLEKEKLKVDRTITTGAKDNRIFIISIYLEKNRHINKFLDFFKEKISDYQKKLIIEQAPTRLDEQMNFFIRLDKQKLMKNKEWVLTDSGKCFHIKISVAAYPNKADVGLKIISDWLA